MFGSTSLEVATGLVFIFLLLSLIVTAVGEIIANIINARAKCLWKGVAALLEDSARQVGHQDPWTVKLYAHPIMRPLFPLETQGKEAELGPKGKGPSYIPASHFATALLDITGAISAEVNTWQQKLQQGLTAIPEGDGGAAAARQVVASIADEIAATLDGAHLKADLEKVAAQLRVPGATDPNVAMRLAKIAGQIKGATLGALQQPLLELAKNPNADYLGEIIALVPTGGVESAAVRNGLLSLGAKLEADPAALATAKAAAARIAATYARRVLSSLDNADLRGALLTLLDQAQGDIEKLKGNVEDWFNHSMDRVQGWYKRKTMWVNVGIAAVLAIFMNVDTLVVLRHLSADPSLRQSVLAKAEAADKDPSLAATLAPSPKETVPKDGSASTPAAPTPPAASTPAPSGDSLEKSLAETQSVHQQLLDLGLPIGWSVTVAPPKTSPDLDKIPTVAALDEYRIPPDWGALLHGNSETWARFGLTLEFHLFGWILTIVAASLGAPFWFDALTRIMNIRATGKPPSK